MTPDDIAVEPTALRITREVPAPPHRVWRAWTDPTELAAWFWPPSFDTRVDVDLQIGGRFRIESPVMGMALSGEFVAVDEPYLLVQTWQWDGEAAVTMVTTEFRAVAGSEERTEVVVVHERFGAADERDNHVQGWRDCLDRLVDHQF